MEKRKKPVDLEAPIKFVCNHVVGENHKPVHRRIAGVVLMVAGVTLAAVCREHCAFKAVTTMTDTLGGLIHAAGAIPILKRYGLG